MFVAVLFAAGGPRLAQAQTLAKFDFTQNANAQEWRAEHDIAELKFVPEGLQIFISGNDPYLNGPPRDYPASTPLWLRVRLKSEQSGTAQMFFFAAGTGPTEVRSVRFAVRGGRWEDARVPLPPLGPNYRLRFDPPGTGGTCLLASVAIEPRILIAPPAWPKPSYPILGNDAVSIQSGLLSLTHAHHQLGGFVVSIGGQAVAVGHTRPLLGYRAPDGTHSVRWLDISQSATMTATSDGGEIVVRATCRDTDGATWYVNRSFRPTLPGVIHILTTVQTDRDRDVVFLPMFMLLSDVSVTRGQALFAGLEYLDRGETSSSEADIRGPGAHRQTPDAAKITFPLMAIQSGANYLGLIWDKPQLYTALFDSPDRTLGTGGSVMGLLYPGSDGSNREEGSLLPYDGQMLKANKPLVLSADLIGGRGSDITPAVQQYVTLRSMPPVPPTGIKWQNYLTLAAGGFLDSGIYADNRYRHAYPNFGAQTAGDVALFLDWLGSQTANRDLKAWLQSKAKAARAQVPDADLNAAGIGHIRYPSPALWFGHVEENAARAQQNGQGLLARFDAQNRVVYHAPPNGLNLGATHFAPDANGLTAQVVTELLQSAVISGDSKLIASGIEKLRALDKFAGTVPRGAQTWEVPLHTPDILASANLLRAYTLGYEITGDPHFLAQAKYWAWTGVPFVYLVNPTDQAVGPYATIAVLGATQWVAPNWIGLPVQWCGLVYADALYRFLKYDPTGPWNQIADGITASGVQQTWPRALDPSRQGLLPDSFNLRAQSRNDAAINPGTLLVNAARLYNKPVLYDFQAFRQAGIYVHAPCELDNARANGQPIKDAPPKDGLDANDTKPNLNPSVKPSVGPVHFAFTAHGWGAQPYYVLLSGFKTTPTVRVNRQAVTLTPAAPSSASAAAQFSRETGRLVLQLRGTAQVEVTLP